MSFKPENVFGLGEEVGVSAMSSLAGFAKGWEALATQATGQALRALSETATAVEQSAEARSAEDLAAIQSHYAQAAWKSAVTGATGLSAVAADMARDMVAPFESLGRRRP